MQYRKIKVHVHLNNNFQIFSAVLPLHEGKYSKVKDHFKDVSGVKVSNANMHPADTRSSQINKVFGRDIFLRTNNDGTCIVNLDVVLDFDLWCSQAPIGLRYSIIADDEIRH